jgi:hypothetical protein
MKIPVQPVMLVVIFAGSVHAENFLVPRESIMPLTVLGSVGATNSPLNAASTATSSNLGGALPAAIQAAMQLPEGKERTDAMRSAAMAWEKQDPRAAMAWVLALPKTASSFEAVRAMANDWGNREAVGAKDWVMSKAPSLKNGTNSILALHLIVTAWARQDAAAAAAWAANQPTGSDVRSTAYYSVADGWGQKDPAASAAWAATLPAGGDRQIALAKAADLWARGGKQPEAAAAWAEKLPAADVKSAAPPIATAWAKTDAEKSKAWVNSLPLADADKAAILAKIK